MSIAHCGLCTACCSSSASFRTSRHTLDPGQSTSIYFDDKVFIVRKEIAQAQIEATRPAQQAPAAYSPQAPATDGSRATADAVRPLLMTRYHGTVSLEPQRINKEMAMIVDEIIQRLASLMGPMLRSRWRSARSVPPVLMTRPCAQSARTAAP